MEMYQSLPKIIRDRMETVNIIGSLAGLFTTIAVIPQIIKALRTKEVADISPVFFSTLILGLALWTTYGIIKNDWPIIITNGVSVLLNGCMLFIYFLSLKRQKNDKA